MPIAAEIMTASQGVKRGYLTRTSAEEIAASFASIAERTASALGEPAIGEALARAIKAHMQR